MRVVFVLFVLLGFLAVSQAAVNCNSDDECCSGAHCMVPKGGKDKVCLKDGGKLCPACPSGKEYHRGVCSNNPIIKFAKNGGSVIIIKNENRLHTESHHDDGHHTQNQEGHAQALGHSDGCQNCVYNH